MVIPYDRKQRLNFIINESWNIIFERIISGRLKINLESSLQLHFSKIILDLGELYCIMPNEKFDIEMETNYAKSYIDIVCHLDGIRAAIELKCFMKSSNRAKDLDMYDVLKDVERLESFDFDLRKFYCLTDNDYYGYKTPRGMAQSVSIKHGNIFRSNAPIILEWAGKWKVNRDKPIILKNEVTCNWITKNNWHYFQVDIL